MLDQGPGQEAQANIPEIVGVDEEGIRLRAYEISQREDAGTPEENWHRAIAELQAESEIPAAVQRSQTAS